jgi:DNA modification methylase
MLNNSSSGQAIYEPFSGSGTTIIACEKESRIALAIELDPVYVDVAIMRWQNFTGKQATLAMFSPTSIGSYVHLDSKERIVLGSLS